MKRIFLSLSFLLLVTSRAFCDYLEDGNAMFAKGDYDGAIVNFTKAIEQDQNNYIAYVFRGYIRQNKGNLADASADYNKAIEINPKI